MMDVVTIIGVVAAYALVFMAAICLLAEKGLHPFRRLRRKFAKLPFFAKLLVLVFGVTLFVHGSLKSPTNDPPRSVPAAQQISQADVERGAVLAGMSANVQPSAFDSQLHPGAATNIPWLLRGAHEDWFAAASETNAPWAFQFGTNLAEGVVVHSGGMVETATTDTPPVTCTLWPFKTPLGIVPEANWGMIAGNGDSQFWHCATPSNTLLLTWRNALLERDTNMPVSVQAELWPNGRFVYRYDLTGAKGKVQSGELGYDSFTNIIIGAALGSSPLQFSLADLVNDSPLSVFDSPFSLSFHPVSAEDLANPDRDGDGLSTADEILVHGTDPANPDTDYDGLTDYEELFVYYTDPLNPHTLSSIYSDGLAVKLGQIDPLVFPEDSTNTVLEHIFYSGTNNGVISFPQSTEHTAVLSVTVSGSGYGDLIVGGKVVPLVGTPPMRGGGQPSQTLHVPVVKAKTHWLWLRGDGTLSVSLDSNDFAFGLLPSWNLHRATGWVNFPNTKATEPCIHDFRTRSRVVTLPTGEGAEALQCAWTGGSGVMVENLPPRSALMTGYFSPRSTSSATYELSHPLYLFGGDTYNQTVRFCPHLEPRDPDDDDDGGDSWYDIDPGEPPDNLGGAYDTTPAAAEDDGEEMDELCPVHEVPYDECAHLHEAEYEDAAELPMLDVLRIRDPLRYEPIQLFAPEGVRNCCPCPEHATNFVGAAYVSPRMSLVDADGLPFSQSSEDCTVMLAGVHPSAMPEDALLSFVTNNGIWRTYKKTVLGVDIRAGTLNLDMLEDMNPVFGMPVPLTTNLQNAAMLDLVTKVGLGSGNVHLELANVAGSFAVWRYDSRYGRWVKFLDSDTSPTIDYSLQRWRKLIVRSGSGTEAMPVAVTSSATGRVDVVFRYWGVFDGKFIEDEATRRLTSVPPPLLADVDGDGALEDGDVAAALAGRPFRFWTNEDFWKGDDAFANEDRGVTNGFDGVVNGRCDLVNLLPIAVDLRPFISAWGDLVQFRLCPRGQGASIRHCFVSGAWNDMKQTCLDDCSTIEGGPLHGASLSELPENGIVLSAAEKTTSSNCQLLIMLEASEACDDPMEIRVEIGGTTVFRHHPRLSFRRVRDMYRWYNRRGVAGGEVTDPDHTGDPSGWPDEERDGGASGPMLVFVHGYNMAEWEARAWSDGVFKRLWWSGMNTKFAAVAWRGNEGQIHFPSQGLITPNYHKNVENAFSTAPALAALLNALPCDKYILAHSLGNMLVSAAIQDYGLVYEKYFMLNAAVPIEAYDPLGGVTAESKTGMTHPEWVGYPDRVKASHWWELFPEGDGRRTLTWKGRFVNVTNAVNYYSSEEEVLADGNGILYRIGREHAWSNQELWKGNKNFTDLPYFSMGRDEAGWGFNGDHDVFDETLNPPPGSGSMPTVTTRHRTPEETTNITNSVLCEIPFFKHFQDREIYSSSNGVIVYASMACRAQLLADAIPVESFAVGAGAIAVWGSSRNVNMATDCKDSFRMLVSPEQYWGHSFFLSAPYMCIHGFFDNLIFRISQEEINE